MIGYLVILTSLACAVLAQVLFKLGVNSVGGFELNGNVLGGLLNLLTQWQVLLGLATYVLGWLLWMNALSRFDLSFVYPFTVLNYVMILGASWLILGEGASPIRYLGVTLICGGVIISARG